MLCFLVFRIIPLLLGFRVEEELESDDSILADLRGLDMRCEQMAYDDLTDYLMLVLDDPNIKHRDHS
jgi:hypothetical protein